MNGEQLVALRINGRARAVRASPFQTLLEILRDQLQLTGAKRGCNQGVCGACTILIDGVAMRSCLSLAVNVADREITTVEGIAAGRELSAVQRAFVELGAVQCGFCTSGMLISASALLHDNPHPSADEARAALAGNLCRCSGYAKIIEAVCRAAEATP
jgi:aerobic-type carbon monoxide dehydrogenase small subunit (CoxS/CutS family)